MQKVVTGKVPSRIRVEFAMDLLRAENRILELLARGAPLVEILETIAITAEEFSEEELFCSILLLDETTGKLLHGAAPHLPSAYNEAIHGVQIGPAVGSCGTAAFRKKPVVVTDI